ncbi:MAG: hypothetical protein M3Y48_12420 [Actinomycetota bacterium]|nr:hypothetical protein [Actinomycetota bacterium]
MAMRTVPSTTWTGMVASTIKVWTRTAVSTIWGCRVGCPWRIGLRTATV